VKGRLFEGEGRKMEQVMEGIGIDPEMKMEYRRTRKRTTELLCSYGNP
jgi:hypothetical protein